MERKRILVPTDLSPSGGAGVRAAADPGHRPRVALTLLRVVRDDELDALASAPVRF